MLYQSLTVMIADGELYTKMKRYILTEDQLRRNGFPRPDPADEDRAILHTITDPNYSNPHCK